MAISPIHPRGAWSWWPLRLVVFFIVLLGAYIGCQFLPFLLIKSSIGLSKQAAVIIAAFINVVVVILFYRVLVRWTESRNAFELEPRRATLLVPGAILGLLIFVAVYSGLWILGIAKFVGGGTTDALLRMFAVSLAAGVGEEIVFRGAVFRLIEEGYGTIVALVASGALFGLLHAANPGATPASTAAIALEAGVLLGASYALTRSLWLPIGLHFGWNFTEGGIFGAAVSGGRTKGLFKVALNGPDYLTGGPFGPEASVVAVAVCLVVAVVMLALAHRRGNWVSPRARLRSAAA